MGKVPIINIEGFRRSRSSTDLAVKQIWEACIDHGFFYIKGHGVSEKLERDLEAVSAKFFNREEAYKMKYQMSNAGKAWRGYFPVGDELTSGKPDIKEGFYFGIEHPSDHPGVLDGILMHGQNQFPDDPPLFKEIVLNYMDEMTELGKILMQIIALSLRLPVDFFEKEMTKEPWTLFRLFHYPAVTSEMPRDSWGVGEHTDYGVLTILKQDPVGGLQINTQNQWIDSPFVEGTFVCNIGDMLQKMTNGYFQATPHRVMNTSGKSRYSFPFFFDPGWDVIVRPLPIPNDLPTPKNQGAARWDQTNPTIFEGTYGAYIENKVGKVFPDLL